MEVITEVTEDITEVTEDTVVMESAMHCLNPDMVIMAVITEGTMAAMEDTMDMESKHL